MWNIRSTPDDVLTCTAQILRRYEEDGESKVDLELDCARQTGGLAVKAWATFVAGAAT